MLSLFLRSYLVEDSAQQIDVHDYYTKKATTVLQSVFLISHLPIRHGQSKFSESGGCVAGKPPINTLITWTTVRTTLEMISICCNRE